MADEGQKGNEELTAGTANRKTQNLCHIKAENLAKLCPVLTWEANLVKDESGHLATETSQHGVECSLPYLVL